MILLNLKKENDQKKSDCSLSIALDALNREYDLEYERSNTLDQKTSFFVTLMMAIQTIYLPLIKFEKINNLCKYCHNFKIYWLFIAFFLYCVSFILTLYELFKLINNYSPQNYQHIKIADISSPKYYNNDKLIGQKDMCNHIREILENNREVNEKKAEIIDQVAIMTFFNFILLNISFCIFKII